MEAPMPDSPWKNLNSAEKIMLKELLAWALMAEENKFLHRPHQNPNTMKSAAQKLGVETPHYNDR